MIKLIPTGSALKRRWKKAVRPILSSTNARAKLLFREETQALCRQLLAETPL